MNKRKEARAVVDDKKPIEHPLDFSFKAILEFQGRSNPNPNPNPIACSTVLAWLDVVDLCKKSKVDLHVLVPLTS